MRDRRVENKSWVLGGMVLLACVTFWVSFAAAEGDGRHIEPFFVDASIGKIDTLAGTLVVAEKTIYLDHAGTRAILKDLKGKTIRLEAFHVGEYVQVTGSRHPDGRIYAHEIRKVEE